MKKSDLPNCDAEVQSRRRFIKFLGGGIVATVGLVTASNKTEAQAANCSKCDCDPHDPVTAKASFALGKFAAGI